MEKLDLNVVVVYWRKAQPYPEGSILSDVT